MTGFSPQVGDKYRHKDGGQLKVTILALGATHAFVSMVNEGRPSSGSELAIPFRRLEARWEKVPAVEYRYFNVFMGSGDVTVGGMYKTAQRAALAATHGPKYQGICKATLADGRVIGLTLGYRTDENGKLPPISEQRPINSPDHSSSPSSEGF